MGRKIDVEEFVNKEYKNKIGEKYKVLGYLFKAKGNHCFDIEFIETKNKQMATLNQIRKGTCLDIIERKKLKRIKTELDLRARNKLVKEVKKTCKIPTNLKDKNVLSVDLSTTSTGIAYSKKGKIVRWKTIKSDEKDFRDRSLYIVSEIVEILKKGKIDTVILEDVFLGLNSNVLSILSEIRGMLMFHIKKMKLDFFIINPTLWKNKVGDVPLHRKEQKEYMMKKFFELTGIKAESDDAADVYMMLYACLK